MIRKTVDRRKVLLSEEGVFKREWLLEKLIFCTKKHQFERYWKISKWNISPQCYKKILSFSAPMNLSEVTCNKWTINYLYHFNTCILLQFNIDARDLGTPNALQANPSATVRIDVIRNSNAPIITNLPTTFEINHNQTAFTTFFTATAVDPDQVILLQSMISM